MIFFLISNTYHLYLSNNYTLFYSHRIVHLFVSLSTSVIQYGNYKLFTSYEDSQVYSPPYTFKEDENPKDASYR